MKKDKIIQLLFIVFSLLLVAVVIGRDVPVAELLTLLLTKLTMQQRSKNFGAVL